MDSMDSPRGNSLLGRALRIVTDVRDDEIPLALVLALNVFLLLTAYYVIKPVREALILALDSGAEYKGYMSAAIAVALLVAVPAYARLVDRLPRVKLVVGVTLFFASHLVLFFLSSKLDAARTIVGLGFYVWVGVFNMMVVAQLWAFATDVYNQERGKRVLPLVALGASLGAALGSKIASWLITPIGVHAMLLVSAAVLLVCAWLFTVAARMAAAPGSVTQLDTRAVQAEPTDTSKVVSDQRAGAFGLVFKHRYVLLIAMFMLASNFANSNGEYILGKLVKEAAHDATVSGTLAASDVGAFIGRSYADFFFAVNVLGVLLQTFLVSRVVRYGGLGPALLVLPVITFSSSVAVMLAPVLSVIRAGKTLENATDYSLNNTVRHMLWLPTSPELKYKAKQAVDTFFVRLGDVGSAGLVLVGTQVFAWSVSSFALANGVVALLALGLALAIWAERRRQEQSEAARNASLASPLAAH
jgi:ATP:ADP antiporter, AAA family